MNINVQKIVISRFVTVFGAPQSADPVALAEEYSRALAFFPAPVLERAVDHLVAEHSYGGWPRIAECVSVCKKFLPPPEPKPLPAYEADPGFVSPTKAQRERVRALVADLRLGMQQVINEQERPRSPEIDAEGWAKRRREWKARQALYRKSTTED
jgi:hypothetical protein